MSTKAVGMRRAAAATISCEPVTPAAVRLNSCFLRPSPPRKKERPSTNRMLPMIAPVIEARITSKRPALRAKKAMISTPTALEKVALRRPPRPGPVRITNCSVDVLSILARGNIANAEVIKSQGPPISANLTMRAMGMKTKRVYIPIWSAGEPLVS